MTEGDNVIARTLAAQRQARAENQAAVDARVQDADPDLFVKAMDARRKRGLSQEEFQAEVTADAQAAQGALKKKGIRRFQDNVMSGKNPFPSTEFRAETSRYRADSARIAFNEKHDLKPGDPLYKPLSHERAKPMQETPIQRAERRLALQQQFANRSAQRFGREAPFPSQGLPDAPGAALAGGMGVEGVAGFSPVVGPQGRQELARRGEEADQIGEALTRVPVLVHNLNELSKTSPGLVQGRLRELQHGQGEIEKLEADIRRLEKSEAGDSVAGRQQRRELENRLDEQQRAMGLLVRDIDRSGLTERAEAHRAEQRRLAADERRDKDPTDEIFDRAMKAAREMQNNPILNRNKSFDELFQAALDQERKVRDMLAEARADEEAKQFVGPPAPPPPPPPVASRESSLTPVSFREPAPPPFVADGVTYERDPRGLPMAQQEGQNIHDVVKARDLYVEYIKVNHPDKTRDEKAALMQEMLEKNNWSVT